MERFTIFTPTFNRSKTLQRVYKSLLLQNSKDFIWIIIDDGSTDNTKELADGWKKECKLNIIYHYKPNGGKHTAMKMAYEISNTKYFIAIDSDDELTPDAIETFNKEWLKIENEGMEDQFAEVSGLTYRPDGTLVGDFYFPDDIYSIDSSWHEMVLKKKNNNEHVVCWNLEKLKTMVKIPDKFWLSERITFLDEFIFWARIGRVYKTRYIKKCLRIYHSDAGESLTRISNKNVSLFNNLVGKKYFLDENLDYFWWNPRYFINLILKFDIAGIELKYSPFYLLNNINTNRFRFAFLIAYPASFIFWIYFKYIKKEFWF